MRAKPTINVTNVLILSSSPKDTIHVNDVMRDGYWYWFFQWNCSIYLLVNVRKTLYNLNWSPKFMQLRAGNLPVLISFILWHFNSSNKPMRVVY